MGNLTARLTRPTLRNMFSQPLVNRFVCIFSQTFIRRVLASSLFFDAFRSMPVKRLCSCHYVQVFVMRTSSGGRQGNFPLGFLLSSFLSSYPSDYSLLVLPDKKSSLAVRCPLLRCSTTASSYRPKRWSLHETRCIGSPSRPRRRQ